MHDGQRKAPDVNSRDERARHHDITQGALALVGTCPPMARVSIRSQTNIKVKESACQHMTVWKAPSKVDEISLLKASSAQINQVQPSRNVIQTRKQTDKEMHATTFHPTPACHCAGLMQCVSSSHPSRLTLSSNLAAAQTRGIIAGLRLFHCVHAGRRDE